MLLDVVCACASRGVVRAGVSKKVRGQVKKSKVGFPHVGVFSECLNRKNTCI